MGSVPCEWMDAVRALYSMLFVKPALHGVSEVARHHNQKELHVRHEKALRSTANIVGEDKGFLPRVQVTVLGNDDAHTWCVGKFLVKTALLRLIVCQQHG